MTRPSTLEELAGLDWKQFETFAREVIRRYYAPLKIDIMPTPFSKDGGRDGEGAYVLKNGGGPESLAIAYDIWLEVKKRSANVDLDDIGKNFVLASNEETVQKLVVVTNSGYAPQAKTAIRTFAARNRMSYSLVTGTELLDLARRFDTDGRSEPEPRASTTPAMEIDASFSRQPNPIDAQQVADVAFQPNEPVFLIADIRRADFGPDTVFTIELRSNTPDVTVTTYAAPLSIRLGAGDRVRMTFAILHGRSALSSENLSFTVTSRQEVTVTATWRGRARISGALLSSWIPNQRWEQLLSWKSRFQNWIKDGGIVDLGLIAYAGVGKSTVLHHLRMTWLAAGAREVYLEGDRFKRDVEMAGVLFGVAFPVDPPMLREEVADAVQRWLSDCGIESERAAHIASELCKRSFRADSLTAQQLADLCASLLRRIARSGRVALVVEDLHFCEPSAIDLLRGIRRGLQSCGDANVAFVCTTRQLAATSAHGAQTEWGQHLDEFFTTTGIAREVLPAFERDDAADVLQRTIPTLERHQADLIIEQVGCTPLALREAVAWFRTEDIVVPDKILGQLTADVDRLTTAIRSDKLRNATRSRIDALKRRFGGWLADLLDGAACVGRFFAIDVVAPAPLDWNPQQRDAIDFCEQLDVIRPIDDGLYAFDHDLIRNALVETLSQSRQVTLATALADRPAFQNRPDIRGTLLYQARRFSQAGEVLQTAAAAAMERNRFGDATKWLLMALTSIDPPTAKNVGQLAHADAAVAHVTVPARTAAPTDDARRRVLELLMKLLQCSGSTAVYATRAAASFLSEATMLARSLRDDDRYAELLIISGVRAFERDDVVTSMAAHAEADRLLERSGANPVRRADNLLRLGIGQRQQNDYPAALATMRRAHHLTRHRDADLLVRITLNIGAVYLTSSLPRVARYWHAALRMAERSAHANLLVHTLIDVGYLELLLRHDDDAARYLSRGYEMARERELDNSSLRAASNLSCLHLARGDVRRALELLQHAELLGVRNEIGRRLWRVRANLANAHEAAGAPEQAYANDSLVLNTLTDVNRLSAEGTRQALPLINMMLRARTSAIHRQLIDAKLPQEIRDKLQSIADEVLGGGSVLPSGLQGALRTIEGRPRFVITE
jgi:hypothetical protein